MDEKGDMTGKKFAAIIAKQITDSNVFLFVCSQNSVASKWVDRELGVADDREKHIIPFACDESYRDDKVIMFTGSHDRIDYFMNPEKEMKKLIDHILKKKAEAEKAAEIMKQREEEEKKKREEEERRKAILEEISTLKLQLNLINIQQSDIIGQLNEKCKSIGKLQIKCPVCGKSCSMDASFCDRCGFQFPLLYTIDENAASSIDPKLLLIHKSVWNGVKKISILESQKNDLQIENKKLTDEIEKFHESIADNDRLKDKLIERDNEINQFKFRNKELEEQLSVVKKQNQSFQKKLNDQKSRNEILVSENQRLEGEIKSVKEDVNRLNDKIQKLKKERGTSQNKGAILPQTNNSIASEKTFDDLNDVELLILQAINRNSKHGVELSPNDGVINNVETLRLANDLKVDYGILMNDSEMTKCKDIYTLLKEIASRYQPSRVTYNSDSGLSLNTIDNLLRKCRKFGYFFDLTDGDSVSRSIDTKKLESQLRSHYNIIISSSELEWSGNIGNLRQLIHNVSRLK